MRMPQFSLFLSSSEEEMRHVIVLGRNGTFVSSLMLTTARHDIWVFFMAPVGSGHLVNSRRTTISFPQKAKEVTFHCNKNADDFTWQVTLPGTRYRRAHLVGQCNERWRAIPQTVELANPILNWRTKACAGCKRVSSQWGQWTMMIGRTSPRQWNIGMDCCQFQLHDSVVDFQDMHLALGGHPIASNRFQLPQLPAVPKTIASTPPLPTLINCAGQVGENLHPVRMSRKTCKIKRRRQKAAWFGALDAAVAWPQPRYQFDSQLCVHLKLPGAPTKVLFPGVRWEHREDGIYIPRSSDLGHFICWSLFKNTSRTGIFILAIWCITARSWWLSLPAIQMQSTPS